MRRFHRIPVASENLCSIPQNRISRKAEVETGTRVFSVARRNFVRPRRSLGRACRVLVGPSPAQYVSLCYPRISRHGHLSSLRPYTDISIPLLTCVKLWAPRSQRLGPLGSHSPSLCSPLLPSALSMLGKARSGTRARERVENNRPGDRANDRGSLMNIVSRESFAWVRITIPSEDRRMQIGAKRIVPYLPRCESTDLQLRALLDGWIRLEDC